MDLSERDVNLFYTAFANQALWPLLHGFTDRVVIRQDAYRAFRRVNRKFAEGLYPLLREGDLVWVHDYHLITLGAELRRLGWEGKMGFFLHVPFAPVDTFAILPWARQILESMFSYDLIGVQTRRYAQNLTESLREEFPDIVTGGAMTYHGRTSSVSVHPIGIAPGRFEEWAAESVGSQPARLLDRISLGRRLILGVERLDYTKGIPERLLAFENLLERFPSLRRRVSLVQISVPSRSQVPEYVLEKERVDQLVGRINGRFAESDWLPVHHLFRSYTQRELAGFYRRADVCLVTPLRDGMNLVAKEFVASQGDPPGVLVLSRFCGSAETMRDALMVNPYDIEGTAMAIRRALDMSGGERRRRWEGLVSGVRSQTAQAWTEGFIAELTGDQGAG
jgi:trehalose 6-phosphate synthase